LQQTDTRTAAVFVKPQLERIGAGVKPNDIPRTPDVTPIVHHVGAVQQQCRTVIVGHHDQRFAVQCEHTRKPDQDAVIVALRNNAAAIVEVYVWHRE
jgi:hypothetical protein